MAVGIPTGFVRKLYRILDHESAAIIAWDADGASFSVLDSAALDAQVLPRYFRGRLCAFRQQLRDHGFARCDCEDDDAREGYRHPHFLRGQPGRLANIERRPQRKRAPARPPISLKVTLTVPPESRKRALAPTPTPTPTPPPEKRLKPVEAPPQKTKNPLFSDDPEPGAMSLAKLVEGSGLLPASSELPDPISYLSKGGGAAAAAATTATAGTMFSDDMVKSTLFFLLAPSCTGADGSAPAAAAEPAEPAPALPTAMTTSTTSFLASLLASSSTAGAAATPFARGSNPLFSDQTTDGDDDSIWNILVASSVDRVRSAIDGVQSPQEKLRLILEEREKLEEQRKKVGAPAGPIVPNISTYNAPQTSAATENASPQKQQNPLFATESTPGSHKEPAEDDLWTLLMSSSIDSFRRVTDLDL
ncbi:unnamed protein product [Phytophthora fragariaefolia]|uniref:Unnamed protein product n=1 Tax=Phytophthora fragariaefolia TaxID=1490495 RepID=A0A9W7CS02_9STRA|nr:unnamed protein product [Phytophthora fragariaefolia]